MKFKTAFYIFGTSLVLTFASCLGDGDNSEIIYSPDAEIISFSIQNDSIVKGLDAIKFSIDQINGEIYNKDSAAYGLKLTDRVILTYSTASGSEILNITNIAEGDSVWVKSGDSIDFTKPLKFRSYAITGDTKEYNVKFNIHKVDPDSIWWKQVNKDLEFLDYGVYVTDKKAFIFNDIFYCFTHRFGNLSGYTLTCVNISSDMGVNWKSTNVNGIFEPNLSQMQQYGDELFVCSSRDHLYKAALNDNFTTWTPVPSAYSIKNIFGTLTLDIKNKKEVLVLAVEQAGKKYFATYDGISISLDDDTQYEVPSEFPTEAFSSISHTRANVGRLTVAGGDKSAVWETMNGFQWTQLGVLPSQIQGANVFLYDDKFYLLNGITNGKYNDAVYTSVNQGLTWSLAPSKTYLPSSYVFRAGASVVVSDDDMIYIIGGRLNEAPWDIMTDIWKGRLNRLNK